ncbi:MAG: class I SAM-dependent methyltransferase [Candidatus Bathyarchaeia archaeon]
MGCHGGFSLDEAVRRTWYNPEAILKDAGLGSGMVFADVGSGDGFFTLLAARMVGETGGVFAVDTDALAIEQLRTEAAKQGLRNVHAEVAAAEETAFCHGCVDTVFYSMVLHDFKDPARVLSIARYMVKPSGKLVDLDWKKLQMPLGPPVSIRFSEQTASELLRRAGFRVQSVKDVGPYHYLIVAKPQP